jgi:Flp pilus assembly protein TadB
MSHSTHPIQHRPSGTSHEERREEIVEVAEVGPGVAFRALELGVVALIGLLVCPPLAILVVVVAVPLLAMAIVAGAIAAVVAIPYLLVRHVHDHHRAHRSSMFAHEFRRLQARRA